MEQGMILLSRQAAFLLMHDGTKTIFFPNEERFSSMHYLGHCQYALKEGKAEHFHEFARKKGDEITFMLLDPNEILTDGYSVALRGMDNSRIGTITDKDDDYYMHLSQRLEESEKLKEETAA